MGTTINRVFAVAETLREDVLFSVARKQLTLPPSLMNNERIVITGVGVMSPNGVGRDQYFAALAGGRSGVRGITHFDASKLTSRVAGEVDFDPAAWIDA